MAFLRNRVPRSSNLADHYLGQSKSDRETKTTVILESVVLQRVTSVAKESALTIARCHGEVPALS
jgi:hypothetical protein